MKHLTPVLALLLAILPGVSAASEEELADLGLEELLEIQLDAMTITGIHHTHDRGEWMVGYQHMFMGMAGNRDGSNRLSPSDLFQAGYMVAPTEMHMEMDMVDVMYAPNDAWTVMLMAPYRRLSMDHITRPSGAAMTGVNFTTDSSGVGDFSVTGIYSLIRRPGRTLVVNAGLSLPTGSIDEEDATPQGVVRLPYPMQLGSGTYDLLPAITYLGQREGWAWGARGSATVRVGENSNNYRLGNRYEATAWGARKLTRWLSSSVQLKGESWGDIHGADPQLNPSMVPTADPNLRAGERLDLIAGFNFFALQGKLAGQRIALEAGVPVYKNLDGPQLEQDLGLSLSWMKTFNP